jgi:hypothetical protein
VQAAADWTRTLGLPDVLAVSEVALMACRGAKYHHDGAQYGGRNLFLSEDRVDLHFPPGHRIPRQGDRDIDTGQPHAVIARGGGDSGGRPAGGRFHPTVYLGAPSTPASALQIDNGTARRPLDEAGLRCTGGCPDTGRTVG